jgi:uncharacterized protein (TIGR02246 family)
MKYTACVVAAALFMPVSAAAEAPATAATTATCSPATESDIAGLFDKWNATLATKDPAKVASLYAADAVLLPTVANTATTPDEIKAYFVDFLKIEPQGKINTRKIDIGCNQAFDVGTYTFSVKSKDGKPSTVAARYSYFYEVRNGEWKIVHHHSSKLPVEKAN